MDRIWSIIVMQVLVLVMKPGQNPNQDYKKKKKNGKW